MLTTELLSLLQRLVRAASVSFEAEVAQEVASFCGSLGLDVERQPVLPGRENIVASQAFNEAGPTLVFNTHMDVVPPGEGWDHNPFDLVVKDNKAYGRGACDAKGALTAILFAVREALKEKNALRGRLVVTAVVDEEDCSRGSRELVRHLHADYGIVGEPTRCMVATCHKGSMRPIVVAEGKSAHASRPEEGVNAIEGASAFVRALPSYAKQLKGRVHPLLGSPSVAVTMIKGGVKENVIPDRCELIIDRRMIPGETEEDVVEEVRALCRSADNASPGCRTSIDLLKPTTGGPSELSVEHTLVQTALSVVGRLLINGNPGPTGLSCGCDMVHLMAAGIPTVVIGPGSLDQAHKSNEFVEVEQLVLATKIYKELIFALLGGNQNVQN